LPKSEWLVALPVSLVLGGALGNLIDRIRFGFVTDFIDFHVYGWHYATFNVADSAVSVGATWLILRLLYESITSKS
jgi:signal peptidase II